MLSNFRAWRGSRFVAIAAALNVIIVCGVLLSGALNRPATSTMTLEEAQMAGAVAVYRVSEGFPDGALAYGTGTSAGYVTAASWGRNNVTYSFENCPATIDCGTAHQAFRDAANAWNAVSGITMTEVGSNGDIRVSWVSDFNLGDSGGRRIDGPSGILGITYFPLSWLGDLAGDVFFDDTENWVVNAPVNSSQIHFPTVALHEIGHAIGLDHSLDGSAVMWAEYVGARGLNDDDIAGAQALYGTPGSGGAPPAAPAGVTLRADVNLRIRQEPTTNSAQIGRLPFGQQADVIGRNAASDWAFIRTQQGLEGWVAAWLTTINGDFNSVPVVTTPGSGNPPAPTPSTPDDPPPAAPSDITAFATTTVVLRSGPGTTFDRIGTVPYQSAVPVLGRTADSQWIFIDNQGQTGWSAAWLFTYSGDLSSAPVVPPDGTGTPPDAPPPSGGDPTGVNAVPDFNLILRAGPGTGFASIGRVPAGTTVPVLGRDASNLWLFVEYQGQQGWIAAWYSTVNGDLNTVPVR